MTDTNTILAFTETFEMMSNTDNFSQSFAVHNLSLSLENCKLEETNLNSHPLSDDRNITFESDFSY